MSKMLAVIMAALLLMSVHRGYAQTDENCWFTPTGDIALYAAPVLDTTQQIGVARAAVKYEVLQQAPESLNIKIDA